MSAFGCLLKQQPSRCGPRSLAIHKTPMAQLIQTCDESESSIR